MRSEVAKIEGQGVLGWPRLFVERLPKAFALLVALIERRPKAISKDELHKLLWPETFVSDANLPNLVAELRETLGDDAHEPRFRGSAMPFARRPQERAHDRPRRPSV